MNSMPLSHAIHIGVTEINRRGTHFKPSMSNLMADLSTLPTASGVIAFASENAASGNHHGYDLVKLAAPEVPSLEATVDDIWQCAMEHFGLTTATGIAAAGGIPISKLRLGHHWAQGSSKYTNLVSHVGIKFFPMTTLRRGSAAAKVAKKTFGTIRVFGIVGRTLPFAAVGLAVIDAISIGMCVYEQRSR